MNAIAQRWAYWPRDTKSPYYGLFYGAMRRYGVVPVTTLDPTEQWLALAEADVVHVHWPESLWRQRGKSAWAGLLGVRRTARFFRAVRASGLRLIWTVHNLQPHERGDWIDRRGYAALAQAADLLLCHNRTTAETLSNTFTPRGDVVVMPHGNFEGVFPSPRPRDIVLADFGLDPNLPVLSCVGYLRPYKGLELACAAVTRLAGRVQFVVAGPAFRFDPTALRHAMAAVPHARLIDRRLSDQEFADLVAASDASLLPYAGVSTSGVLLASWTLGTGVVASDLAVFREMMSARGAAGALFRAGDPDSLAAAIQDFLAIPLDVRRRAAREEASRYSWDECVQPVVQWLAARRTEG